MWIEVAVGVPVRGSFTYEAEDDTSLAPGQRLLVPFGKRKAIGFYLGPASERPDGEVRFIDAVLDEAPVFPPDVLALIRFAADYYLYPLGEALRTALPPDLGRVHPAPEARAPAIESISLAESVEVARAALGRSKRGMALVEYLAARGGSASLEELKVALRDAAPLARKLEEKGLLRIVRTGAREPDPIFEGKAAPDPTAAQLGACDAIAAAGGRFRPFLLHGVTGSGKTEVYLRSIERVREAGKGALVLVPEIALTPQLAGRFRSRFGGEIAVLHSGLSDRDRTREHQRLLSGEAAIALGVRSAVFAPVRDLGIVVVDEEHEPSFKQEEKLRYHARDLAVYRAKLASTPCVLGSATPSLETLANARDGRYQLLRLPERVDARPMPTVQLVDLAARRAAQKASATRDDARTPRHAVGGPRAPSPWAAGGPDDRTPRHAVGGPPVPSPRAAGGPDDRTPQHAVGGPPVPSPRVAGGPDDRTPRHAVGGPPAPSPWAAGAPTRLDAGDAAPGAENAGYRGVPSARSEGVRTPAHPAGHTGKEPTILGPELLTALGETLDAGKQAILFLNRRGHASLVLCPTCGEGARCPNCDVALTHHLSRGGELRCHYCDHRTRKVQDCAACGTELLVLGVGTERVERELAALVPRARIVRLDRDAAATSAKLTGVLASFARGEADVLVGTQMVAKGHDFPGVTLVGAVLADVGLGLPDFRAAERTFQLLTQVAGRAGRGKDPGRVIIQTFNAGADAVACVRTHDFDAFAAAELDRRRELGYPPFGRALAVRLESEEPGAVEAAARRLGDRARSWSQPSVRVLGPAPAPIARLRGRTRYQLLLLAPGAGPLQAIGRRLTEFADSSAKVRIALDMDPVSML